MSLDFVKERELKIIYSTKGFGKCGFDDCPKNAIISIMQKWDGKDSLVKFCWVHTNGKSKEFHGTGKRMFEGWFNEATNLSIGKDISMEQVSEIDPLSLQKEDLTFEDATKKIGGK